MYLAELSPGKRVHIIKEKVDGVVLTTTFNDPRGFSIEYIFVEFTTPDGLCGRRFNSWDLCHAEPSS